MVIDAKQYFEQRREERAIRAAEKVIAGELAHLNWLAEMKAAEKLIKGEKE